MRNVIVGTAGHIDHGKSTLVRALTGIDTDRLAEEKRRGISIDLGFAHLPLSADLSIGFVDVPGHERFVKNMLAGASGIDLALLVVAATESIKPQTREHFDICRLLGIESGVVAITKSDLADPDLVELVKLEVAELVAGSFLEGAAMVPVSATNGNGLPELRDAKAVLDECRAELRGERTDFDDKIEVGMMIEVPSAAMIADLLAKEVSFFSLGTNDLVQYATAVDRTNERIAHLYEPTHPAVLRLIKMTVDAAQAAGIHVGLCGEMGGDISVTPLLIGLGVNELSCGAAVLPRVKRAICSLDMGACRNLAESAMKLDTGAAVQALCEEVARAHYPELL